MVILNGINFLIAEFDRQVGGRTEREREGKEEFEKDRQANTQSDNPNFHPGTK